VRTIKLIVEYDGTNYAGWQVQPNGLAIQQLLEEGLARLVKHPVRLSSSGRTDAGVHARGMVAAFSTETAVPVRAFRDGLNALLPPDIAVLQAVEAALEFNPRRDAIGKQYRYTILAAQCRSPLARLYAWHLRKPLDLARMRQAAALFVGEHDFAAFRTTGCAAKTTVRRITALEIVREGAFIHVDVYGTGFLRNMVRIMVGTLVEVGAGRFEPDRVSRCLGERGCAAGPTAPAHGLCLMEVYY
jgi:tRNA pseudouridine38-40 synthase